MCVCRSLPGKGNSNAPWREAGPPNRHDDKVDSDMKKSLSAGRLRASSQSCTQGTDADSYLRLIDSCITQRKAQGPFRTCNESKEECVCAGRLRASSQSCTQGTLPWREAGPPNHHDDKVDSDQ